MEQVENIERSRERGIRSTQLAASIGLSLLFLILYPLCNWLAAQRAYVPSLFFGWERAIPFVPLMIAPYMSLDLLFVAAPFLCRNNRELATLSKRIVAALLVAGVCFLLFPLRFAFERPPLSGWLGDFFAWFGGLDRPFNLLPSLHIAFCTILGEFYARQTRRALRHAFVVWFVLIAFSAVLTFQHHTMDVVGGFALGAYCLYFFPESNARVPFVANRRVGFYYSIGAVAAGSLVILFWPWGAFLLWPFIAFSIMTGAYFWLGPSVFRKRDGRLPWTTWWALGPILFGHKVSRLYYRRRARPWDRLTSSVWIGGVLTRREAISCVREGVTAVLDLTAEFSEPSPFRALAYKNIPILDLTSPITTQLREMVSFIERESAIGIVYVHCKIGYSRTAAVAAAYLLGSGAAASVSEAIDHVRRLRPCVVIRPEVLTALREYATDGFSSRLVTRSFNNDAAYEI
ncbi:MAG: phosphatase PAP2/dual specificity phosphatase family protein [Chthoniobacterales bacterium]